MLRPIKRAARTLIAFSAVIAIATPIAGRQASFIAQQIQLPDDDELLPDSDGAVLLLHEHSHRADNADWLKFETDPCGFLDRVESRHSIFRQSGLADNFNDFDQPDPSDEARTMFGRWLSSHAEIAVISDAIDKSCDSYLPDDSDEDLAPTILAGAPIRTHQRKAERIWVSRLETFHIV
jgi:hypothetical protein